MIDKGPNDPTVSPVVDPRLQEGVVGQEAAVQATPAESAAVALRLSGRLKALRFFGTYGTIVVLVVMIIVFAILSPSAFFQLTNGRNILTAMAPGAIVAGGLTFPLVAGDFDLSIGYVTSFACVLVVGLIADQSLSVPAALAIVLVFGALIGLVNGLIVTKLGVNAFIATLGTGTMIVGANYAYSGGIPIALPGNSGFTSLGLGELGGVPNPIIIMAIAFGILWFVLTQTSFGQHVRAVGQGSSVARRTGIPVDRTRIIAFIIAGLCAAFTGALLGSVLAGGETTAGDSYMLQSFAAAFLGSAALRDGEFHQVGTFLGVLTVAVGFNGLAILGAPTWTQYVFSGGLLVVAVTLSTAGRRYAAR